MCALSNTYKTCTDLKGKFICFLIARLLCRATHTHTRNGSSQPIVGAFFCALLSPLVDMSSKCELQRLCTDSFFSDIYLHRWHAKMAPLAHILHQHFNDHRNVQQWWRRRRWLNTNDIIYFITRSIHLSIDDIKSAPFLPRAHWLLWLFGTGQRCTGRAYRGKMCDFFFVMCVSAFCRKKKL